MACICTACVVASAVEGSEGLVFILECMLCKQKELSCNCSTRYLHSFQLFLAGS